MTPLVFTGIGGHGLAGTVPQSATYLGTVESKAVAILEISNGEFAEEHR